MNGPINGKLVLDSNVVINFFNKKIAALPGANNAENPQYIINVVTEMEALANPRDTEESRKEMMAMLEGLSIIPLTEDVKNIAIAIRRSGSPRPKLPDAIIAATAVLMNAPPASADDALLKLSWPGLQTVRIT
jgi:predicted nucleic acid-binding protein